MTLGTILMCFLQKRDAKGEETLPDSSVSFYSSMVSMSKAEYTKYIVEPTHGESGVGGAMAMYGAFDAICSLAMGRLTSGLKSITLIVCAGAFIQLFVTSGVLGILYPLLIAAALGIGDGIFNTQLNALLGKLFKHDMEGAIAQLKVWQCVLIAVVFFVSPHVSLHAVLVVMHVAVCISVVREKAAIGERGMEMEKEKEGPVDGGGGGGGGCERERAMVKPEGEKRAQWSSWWIGNGGKEADGV
ncbi:UNC93-like protein 3 [Camellia lanceoleosa]|uniref:UNC93-like protein 3 n=1 Tax=Camellia lanceoleosa TaxID=1840588 RepID=A0ACC0HUK6_9ERIC|nr:UNC93-like protein 3 [Camellia lanceoleosa]